MENRRKIFWSHFLCELERDIRELTGHRHGMPRFKGCLISDLIDELSEDLDNILSPTLVTLMGTRKGALNGSVYESIFQNDYHKILKIIQSFHSQTVINLYSKIRRYRFNLFRLVDRLCSDWDEIKTKFNFPEDVVISYINMAAGDEHFYGDRASIILLDNSDKLGFIYKPINLNVELLMDSVKNILFDEPVLSYSNNRVISKGDSTGDYGYIKLYECNGDATDESLVKKTYYNFGGLLAMGKCFSIIDGHLDNIIISVPKVWWVDMETAFHFETPLKGSINSLEMTGIIAEINENNFQLGIVSGMQGGTIPKIIQTSPTIYNDGTDDMRIEYFGLSKSDRLKNCVYLRSKRCDPYDYLDSIKSGYHDCMVQFFLKRTKILSLIRTFFEKNRVIIRVIMQNTVYYSRLITLAQHIQSDLSRNIVEIINSNKNSGIDKYKDVFGSFISENELIDVLNGVIPYFYRSSLNRSLYHASGAHRGFFFKKNLFQDILYHIKSIDVDDISIGEDFRIIERALNSTYGIGDFDSFKKRFTKKL